MEKLRMYAFSMLVDVAEEDGNDMVMARTADNAEVLASIVDEMTSESDNRDI